jgi:hypothetical protein
MTQVLNDCVDNDVAIVSSCLAFTPV